MTDDWRIRQATIADIGAIVDLRNEVYATRVSPGEWRWKYFDNPAGSRYILVAAIADKIVGHVGHIRGQVNVKGQLVPIAHSGDGFVYPEYRRQGILTALLTRSWAAATSDGIQISLGLATPMGKASTLKLGYQSLGNMIRLWMVLNPRAMVEKRTGSSLLAVVSELPLRLLLRLWAGRTRRAKGTEDITIETVDRFDARFDELWSTIKGSLPLGLWQDAEYLNWRYCACPVAQYTVLAARNEKSLLGFIVLKWGDESEERYRTGKVVDFLFMPQEIDAARPLISAAVNYFENEGADAITCDIFSDGPFYRALRSCGFFRWGKGLCFMIRLETPDVPRSLLLDPGNWYVMESFA